MLFSPEVLTLRNERFQFLTEVMEYYILRCLDSIFEWKTVGNIQMHYTQKNMLTKGGSLTNFSYEKHNIDGLREQ